MELHTSTTSRNSRNPQSVISPLLGIVLVGIAGLLLASKLEIWQYLWIVIPVAIGCLYSLRFTWGEITILSLVLILALLAYLQRKSAIRPELSELPSREIICSLEIDRVFHSRNTSELRGLGTLFPEAPHLRPYRQQRVGFSLINQSGIIIGKRILVRGVCVPAEQAFNADDSYREYLAKQGIELLLIRGEVHSNLESHSALELFRKKILNKWENALLAANPQDSKPGDVFASMILGQSWRLSDQKEEQYKFAGTLHLFAISGIHVASFALALQLLLTALRMPNGIKIPLILSMVYLYVWVTGSTQSAVRAAIMVTAWYGGQSIYRQTPAVTTLALSLAITLLWDPFQIWQPGFQLSYSVVGAIVISGLPLGNFLVELTKDRSPRALPHPTWFRVKEHIKRRLCQSFCISLSATAASSPWVLAYFEILTPGASLLNMILAPVTFLIVLIGALVLMSSVTFGTVSGFFLNPAAWIILMNMEWAMMHWTRWFPPILDRIWATGYSAALALFLFLISAWYLEFRNQSKKRPSGWELFVPYGLLLAAFALGSVQS